MSTDVTVRGQSNKGDAGTLRSSPPIFNMYIVRPPEISKALQNVENGVVWGG